LELGAVLFTDESRFWLLHIDGRVRVWRRPGERHLDETLEEKVPFGGGSIMVWSEIIFNGRTELVVIREGSMTARRYIDEVLKPHVVPFAQNMGPEFILQQDNTCPHVARLVLEVTLLDFARNVFFCNQNAIFSLAVKITLIQIETTEITKMLHNVYKGSCIGKYPLRQPLTVDLNVQGLRHRSKTISVFSRLMNDICDLN
jgi:hypothetical protein